MSDNGNISPIEYAPIPEGIYRFLETQIDQLWNEASQAAAFHQCSIPGTQVARLAARRVHPRIRIFNPERPPIDPHYYEPRPVAADLPQHESKLIYELFRCCDHILAARFAQNEDMAWRELLTLNTLQKQLKLEVGRGMLPVKLLEYVEIGIELANGAQLYTWRDIMERRAMLQPASPPAPPPSGRGA